MDSWLKKKTEISDYSYVYRNWAALSGYFDGDGTVEIRVKGLWVEIRLAFDDNWKPFLDGVRAFLVLRGVRPGKVRRKMQSKTWHVVISNRESVEKMCRAMLPYVVKKRIELQAVLDYLANGITGYQFIAVINEQVSSGQRTGKLRPPGPPFTRKVAARMGQESAILKRRQRRQMVHSNEENLGRG